MQPVIFIGIDFFKLFCIELYKPLLEVKMDKKILIFFEELIFQKGNVYINISENEIANILCSSENDKITNQLRRLSNIRGKIKSCKSEIEIFRQKKTNEFLDLEIKPDFILLNEAESYCKEISELFGVVCTSSAFSFNPNNSYVQIKIVDKDQNINLEELTSFLYKPNAIIIEDPHLFDNDLQGLFFIQLIKALYPYNFKGEKSFITLIFANEQGINIDNIKQKLQAEFPKLIIEYYSRNKRFLHDRNIYSNTFWISCDYGFKRNYSKPTKWTFYPLGIYYSEFSERKRQSTIFERNEKDRSQNPLIKFVTPSYPKST